MAEFPLDPHHLTLGLFGKLRLDRVLTLYLCAPVLRLVGATGGRSVPILAYHSISDNLFGYSHPYYQINTSPAVFTRQMKWLRNAGYHTLSLHDLPAAFESGADLSKRFVITFDDGYRDFYTDGINVLRQCGFSATIFLVTDRIQSTSARIEGADYLAWKEVRELHDEGISFGSHTVTHPDLRSLGPEHIEYELGRSKETIEQNLGVPTELFSYAFGFPEEDRHFIRFLEDLMENLGYKLGVSTILGRASARNNKFFMPRLPVNSWDDVDLLRAKLEGGYDWLHGPQLLKKSVLHNVALMRHSVEQEGASRANYQ